MYDLKPNDITTQHTYNAVFYWIEDLFNLYFSYIYSKSLLETDFLYFLIKPPFQEQFIVLNLRRCQIFEGLLSPKFSSDKKERCMQKMSTTLVVSVSFLFLFIKQCLTWILFSICETNFSFVSLFNSKQVILHIVSIKQLWW